MEDLLSALVDADTSSKDDNRLDQYKKKGNALEKRRKQFLEALKEKRYNYLLHSRCLAENEWKDDELDKDMEWNAALPSKPSRANADQLMLSEWLTEVPSDFEENWLMKFCPKGIRCLVVASLGSTKAYAKNGWKMQTFPSWLPGGKRASQHSSSFSILDCVHPKGSKTFYVLDMMCWKGQSIYDTETQFRFYWMEEKISEFPELKKNSRLNPFNFLTLPCYSCHKQELEKSLNSNPPFNELLDGILFYHKEAHYFPGRTPLVGWLKGFMVTELLNMPVNSQLCLDKPENYVSMTQFIVEYSKEQENTSRRTPKTVLRRESEHEMDT